MTQRNNNVQFSAPQSDPGDTKETSKPNARQFSFTRFFKKLTGQSKKEFILWEGTGSDFFPPYLKTHVLSFSSSRDVENYSRTSKSNLQMGKKILSKRKISSAELNELIILMKSLTKLH